MPASGARGDDVAQHRLDLLDGRAVRLGHEDRGLARVEHVDVERDVDRVGALERTVERVVDPGLGHELHLGRVEVARADERDVLRPDDAVVEEHSQRHPPRVARRRGLGRVQVAMRVEPDDRETAAARRETAHRADVRAAASAEDDRPLGQHGGELGGLLLERVALDRARLGIRERERRAVGHRLAALPPRPRNAHEAGGELASARVALVAGADRDRRERAAVRAARAQRAHAGAFS